MKKIICLIITIFICSITINVKAAGTVVFSIDANGELNASAESNGRYTYENGVLTLTNVDNDTFVLNGAQANFTLRTTTDVKFYAFTTTATVTIETEAGADLGSISGNGIVTINNSKNVIIGSSYSLTKLNINNSEVKLADYGSTYAQEYNIKNSTIEVGRSVTGGTLNIEDSTINGKASEDGLWTQTTNNNYKNSTINLKMFYVMGADKTTFDNTTINLSQEMNTSNSNELDIISSTINFGDYLQLSSAPTNITDSTIKCNSTGNRNQMHNGGGLLNIKNSKLELNNLLFSGENTNFDNSELTAGNTDVFFIGNVKDSKISIAAPLDTSINDIKNSDIKFGNVRGSLYLGNNNDGVIENSTFEAKVSVVTMNNPSIKNSNIKFNNSGVIGGTITSIEKSEMLVNGTSFVGARINQIVNSHLIFYNENDNDAYYPMYNVMAANDIVALDDEGNLLEFKLDDNSLWRFYKNGEVSNYVEIRSPMNIVAKVVNGTWEDGSNEDKKIKTYYGVKLSDIIPTGMIANPGYKAGSWNIEVNEDKIFDTIELVYTFVEEDTNEEVEEAKEEDVVNPKTADSLSTIKIIALFVSIIGLLGKIIITYKKKIG